MMKEFRLNCRANEKKALNNCLNREVCNGI